MRKFFKPKEILLLGLANLLDAAEEIQDPFRLMSSSYKSMYGWIPRRYRKHNFYQLISRSLRAELIEKIEKNGEIYLRITTAGKKTIQRDFPMLQLQNRKWDGKWRIVTFDVEEINKKARNRLRKKLKELGFGMLQKSVFISPHDLLKDFSEFAESSGIKNYLYLLETYDLTVGDKCEFANKVWKLDELNEKYQNIIERINKIKNSYMIRIDDRLRKSDSQKEKDNEDLEINKLLAKNIKETKNIKAEWLKTVVNDPFLPKVFLPKPWYGGEAEKLVRGLKT